jgi:YD repeat-containing protein
VVYSYDALGRLIHAEYGNTTITYNYDKAGNRTSVKVAANGAPVAADDAATTSAGSVTFDPRYNDTDPDGDILTISGTGNPTPPSHGNVTINSGRTLTYAANAAYHGSDLFSYAIDDGHGHAATGTVTITVP